MSRRSQDDEVINFTPESGFTIESLAATVVQMMRELDMDACVNLPDRVVLEIEKECTAKEIIAGYKKFIARKIKSRTPSNKNEKEPVTTK
ncbi:MAG: hypothetical protein V1721_05690 [Pseudomonadota bacterium]